LKPTREEEIIRNKLKIDLTKYKNQNADIC